MADTVFNLPNVAPNLIAQDQNYTCTIFAAPKAAGLTIASTSGWQSPGPVVPGSYDAPLSISTNETKLGSVKVAVSQHVNDLSKTVTVDLNQITPFGQRLKNRTVQTPTATYATGSTTIDTAGGGLSVCTLASAADFSVDDVVEFIIGAGASQYKDYRRITNIASATITLDYPLAEVPADGTTVKEVQNIAYREGLSQLAKWSLLVVHSGDEYSDQLIHHYGDARITEGNNSMPDANVGQTKIQATIFPSRETISGKVQPVFGTENLKFQASA